MPSRWQRSRTEFTSFPYPPGGLIGNPSDFREERKGSRSLGGHEPPPGGLKSTPALGLPFRWEGSSYLARARKPTTRSHARSPRPFSQPGGLERALTRSQPDSSRRGGKPRSPRTGISGAGPAWVPLLRVVRAEIRPRTPSPGCGTTGPRGAPFVPPPAARPPPQRSAAPLRRPPDPGNSQTGRYHPRAAGGCGEGSQGQSPTPPRPAASQATSGRSGRGRRRRRQGDPEVRATRGPHALPPAPGGAMVRSAARTRPAGRAPAPGARGEALGQPQAACGRPVPRLCL